MTWIAISLALFALLYYLRYIRGAGLKWFSAQLAPASDAPGAKLPDVATYCGLAIALAGVVIGWFAFTDQSEEARLQIQRKDLTDSIASLQAQNREAASRPRSDFAPDIDLHLESPIMDAALIVGKDRRAEFRWQYARHTPEVHYVIEVAQPSPSEGRPEWFGQPKEPSDCDFARFQSCRFWATDPAAQRSDAPAIADFEGNFFWRVVPAKARKSDEDGFSQLSEWSEYEPFSVYPSVAERIKKRERILIGTTNSNNVRFSMIDAHGHHRGYDMDLIRHLVDDCIRQPSLDLDLKRCDAITPPGDHAPKNAEIRSYSSVQAGLDAVSRREIDLFIGAVTQTTERQKGALKFTDGYFRLRTGVYGRTDVNPNLRFRDWVKKSSQPPRRLGVVQQTTNDQFAGAVADELGGDLLNVIALPDYERLKRAMEQRTIDAALVDCDLGADLLRSVPDTSLIKGLEDTSAWNEYRRRLNLDQEEFAIAVATDNGNAVPSHRRRWFDLKPVAANQPGQETLLSALNGALQHLGLSTQGKKHADATVRRNLDRVLSRNFDGLSIPEACAAGDSPLLAAADSQGDSQKR